METNKFKQNIFPMKYFYTIAFLLILGFQSKTFAQQKIAVTGVVYDGSTRSKQTLPGATVLVDGKVVAQTGSEGNYRVTVNSDAVLTFSYIGFIINKRYKYVCTEQRCCRSGGLSKSDY